MHRNQKSTPNKSSGIDWRGRVLPTYWSIGAGLSILLNFILLVVVVVLLGKLTTINKILTNELVGGLYYNFVLMDQATIETTVQVEETIPVQFDLPLEQKTVVVLTEDTTIEDATVTLNTGGLNIRNAPTDIVLPKGTRLPVRLDLSVPVDTEIPISLTVPVNIPLSETELHRPFTGLQDVVAPFFWMLMDPPSSFSEATCQYWQLDCP
ncbi:MAG: hypothetical protein JW757_07185 [Anaerolineales bacterium]|nr:hypothetical protein [Anaerolineales bacterium]